MKGEPTTPGALRMRKLRRKRRRARTCPECGDPPAKGKKYCAEHLYMSRMHMRKARRSKAEADPAR